MPFEESNMFSSAMGAARPVDVTEYHVLRSQRNAANDGGRCELSEMKSARRHDGSKVEGCGTRTDRYFLQKHVISLCGDNILPQN